jgi:putative transposase
MVHKYWRCHNKSHLLQESSSKRLYLGHTVSALRHKSVSNAVKLHAFCVMGNHSHQVLSYEHKSEYLSRYMRIAHGGFGRAYNAKHKRTGKVANERPGTALIQSDSYAITSHLYVEANPVRSGLNSPENLRLNRYSSFRFYAYGIRDEFTNSLCPPSWYMELGKSWRDRQRAYRKMFYAYLANMGLASVVRHPRFIGDLAWQEQMSRSAKNSCSPDTS